MDRAEPRDGDGAEKPQQKPFRNPFRSEADAFRLLGIIGVAVAAIVLAAKIGGAWLGVPVTLVLLAIATRATLRWLKVAVEARDDLAPPPP